MQKDCVSSASGGKPCIRLRAAVESGGRRGSRRVAVQERGGSGSRGRPRWRWRGRPRVRVTWYKAGSHLATNTNREERPPRERQRPPSPPLAAAVPARRAPPARHRHHRARVTNAPGDREPRAPDSWHPAADGDCRGTLVQPPAQPVIKKTHVLPLDTACPSSSPLPLLDEPLPESLLPRPLEEPSRVAATAASLAAGD